MPTFRLVGMSIRIWLSDKKGRRKGPRTVPFLRSATNSQKHPKKESREAEGDALTIVCCSSSGVWCCCNCGQPQKQQTKKSRRRRFDRLDKPKKEERNSSRCQPFVSSWRFDPYRAKPQKREKQGQGRQRFRSFGHQPTCQNPKIKSKEAEF